MTSSVEYLGNLRTTATHLASEKIIITDAPVDNHGKGEAFSPTDLVATALASCLITIMGIKAKNLKVDIDGTKAEVTKVMGTEPRRIVEVKIHIFFPKSFDEKTQKILEKAGLTCPIANSLHPQLNQRIRFIWPS
ncbi:MAG: OsmC family protein [Flavobacteriaceae bacterium]